MKFTSIFCSECRKYSSFSNIVQASEMYEVYFNILQRVQKKIEYIFVAFFYYLFFSFRFIFLTL